MDMVDAEPIENDAIAAGFFRRETS